MKHFSFLIFLLVTSNMLPAQTSGCTDPQANNFNAAAIVNDGSCTYKSTSYSPGLVGTLSSTLKEISGLIYFNNKLLALNDGGGGNKLYMLDTLNGNILQTITVEGATNVDWEDISQDSNYVYVGDIGNNAHGNRTDLCIYKINKNAFVNSGDFIIPAIAVEKINYSYADQSDFTSLPANSTRFDCESLLILHDSIHLFTKNWIGDDAVHYVLPLTAGTYLAARLDSMNTGGFLLTGADAGANDEILFTSYNSSGGCAFFLVYGFGDGNYFLKSGNKRKISLPGVLSSGQVESVCFVNGIHGFIANEYFSQSIFNVSNKLHRFTTDQWVIDYYKHKPSPAVEGMMRYNVSTGKYELFTSSQWEDLN